MRTTNILIAGLMALFALSLGAAPPWKVLVSTNSAAPSSFFTAGTYSSAVGFVELQAPSGVTIMAGTVVTSTNATATLSNGTLTISAAIASNSLKQLESMNATNVPLQLNLVGQ